MIRPTEGGFASNNPRTQVLAGAGALVAADPVGLEAARFGWADLTLGTASNERTTAAQRLGFVLPLCGDWQRVYVERGQRWIRPGLPITLCVRGDFWARFSGGAVPGQRVYADPLDGSLLSGYVASAELTPWSVITSAAPGQLAIISTWSNFP